MCGSMADIQSPTAEIRRGKKKEKRKKEETTWQKYNGLPYSIGRPCIDDTITYSGSGAKAGPVRPREIRLDRAKMRPGWA